MPVVNIEYDGNKVSLAEIRLLVDGAHQVIASVTGTDDVPVYAHDAEIKAKTAPIEIFIRYSDHKVKDVDGLTQELRRAFSAWKSAQGFPHPINMTFIPINWKIEMDI